MSKQTALHLLPSDLNRLLLAFPADAVFVSVRHGDTATAKQLAFLPDTMTGKIVVVGRPQLTPSLRREYVAKADPPFFRIDEQAEAVIEVSMSGFTEWRHQRALTQGRIYAVTEGKPAEFQKWYDRLVRYIRRVWRKNPASWMGGYIGPAAYEFFVSGGLLLPNYVPPVNSEWIERLSEQNNQRNQLR